LGLLLERPVTKLIGSDHDGLSREEFLTQLVTVIVLFCFGGTGIYASLDSGMTGDHSVLIAKSILDFFTAAIFACNIGYVVSLVAIPQFAIFFSLYLILATSKASLYPSKRKSDAKVFFNDGVTNAIFLCPLSINFCTAS